MAFDLNGLIFPLSAYLLGSIPFGLVVSRLCGAQDPRQAGSGNIGSTNVFRLSGKKVGILTLLGDLGKGLVVGWVSLTFYSQTIWALVGLLAVVVGHIFPVFLKFCGGKGVATGLGAILGFHFGTGLILVLIWLGTVALFKYSSAGALVAFGVFPIVSWIMAQDDKFLVFSILLSCMIIFKHKGNIERLLKGTESRIGSNST
jgi:glycerol-3-phosphate acyltransferase PlsY